jgi:hypothetical protein
MAVSTVGPTGLSSAVGQIGKNLIQNGAFRVSQRGTSFTGLGDSSANPPTMDRWFHPEESDGGGRYTVTQESGAGPGNGFTNHLSVHCTTADGTLAAGILNLLEQRIEAQNLQHIMKGTAAAKPLTMSFWVKSSQTGVMNVLIRADDNSDRSYLHNYTINVADTWEYKSYTIPGDTTGVINNDTGRGFSVMFVLAVGSTFQGGTADAWATHNNNRYGTDQTVNVFASTDDDWSVTGVQLEVGSVATDFEHEPISVTLAKCQRYFYRCTPTASDISIGYCNAVREGKFNFSLPVVMRAVPSIAHSTASEFSHHDGDATTGAIALSDLLLQNANSQPYITLLSRHSGGSTYTVGQTMRLVANDAAATFDLTAEL